MTLTPSQRDAVIAQAKADKALGRYADTDGLIGVPNVTDDEQILEAGDLYDLAWTEPFNYFTDTERVAQADELSNLSREGGAA